MAIVTDSGSFTPRESEQMAYDERMFDKQADYNYKMAVLEGKWASWLRIPITIIKLPVLCIMAIGYVVATARNKEPGDNFWSLLK